MRRPPIGVMQPDRARPLADRIGVSPGAGPGAVEARKHIHGVAAVQLGEQALSLAWARLVGTEHDPEATAPSPTSWTMDLETISYGKLPTQDYAVRIMLKDGRTLVGDANLVSTNGRLFHFESRGNWTGFDDEEAASAESAESEKPPEPVAVST